MKADINLQTKVASLLQDYPQLEEKLIELSPIFSKLKNPVLRRTIAKVTSLQQAAEVAGISSPVLIAELRDAAGLSEMSIDSHLHADDESIAAPSWFAEDKIVATFDARRLIEAGESPMQIILDLASKLEAGKILQVITPFKPVPIIDILKSRGFENWSNGNDNFFIKN